MATAMFQKLRIGSNKDKFKIKTGRKDSISTPPSSTLSYIAPPREASLLGLPPELRNLVFEFLARDTRLNLVAAGKKRVKRPPVVGLLLANKQTHREFYPVLLATAHISAPIAHFDFVSVPMAIERRTQDELRCLAVNPRIYLTQLISHTPRPEELDNLAVWLTYRAQDGSHSRPGTTNTEKPNDLAANSLLYRYDARLDPPRSMASTQNMKVALLTALIRQLARLTGPEYGGPGNKVERQRMMVDLTECKDELMGLKRSLAEREAEVGAGALKKDSPFFGVHDNGFAGMMLR